MNNYVDQYGRYHHKPVTESDPLPSNNGYIYSFYAAMVGLPVQFSGAVLAQLGSISTTALTRHPGDNTPPISHDEYVGVAGLDKHWANAIVEYGEKNYFQYCDIPEFKAVPFRKLDINDVISGFEDLANEKNPRTAVYKYPSVWNVAFWHRPEQQYFYYRCAERSPGIIRTLYFIIASLFTIFSKDQSSPMLGFKLRKLMQKPKLADRLINWIFNKRCNLKELAAKEFPTDHPIMERL